MHPMNLPVRDYSEKELGDYFASFDNVKNFLFGIFGRASHEFCGFWMMDVAPNHRVTTHHLAIDRKHPLAPLISLESTLAIGDWNYESGVEKATLHVVAGNKRAQELVEAVGFELEGTLKQEVPDLTGGEGRVDLLRYGALRETYPVRRKKVEQLIKTISADLR